MPAKADHRPPGSSVVALLTLLLLVPGMISAQAARPDSGQVRHPGAPQTRDSLLIPPAHTPAGQADSATFHPRKSPATAMLLSAILPGAGQFYNESYWKVPVVAGLGAYFVTVWLESNRKVQQNRDLYTMSLAANPTGDYILAARSDSLKRAREFYKDQRDSFAWYFLILYMVSIADAYVDASLFDFNVGGDLSLRFGGDMLLRQPPGGPALPPVSCTLRFRL